MGYSIAIRPKSKALKDKMMFFMERNFRIAPEVFRGLTDIKQYSMFSDDLAYDHGRWAIGFDYNSAGIERDYIFFICSWMAIKIGKTKRCRRNLPETPYYVYDGGGSQDDYTPIIIGNHNIPDDYKWAITDRVGYQPVGYRYYNRSINKKKLEELIDCDSKLNNADIRDLYKAIKKELYRLDKLWNKEIRHV